MTTAEPSTATTRHNTALTAVSGLFVYGLSAITGPLLAHSLEATGRGDYAAVIVPTQVLGYLVLFGLPLAAMYYAHERPHRELVMSSWLVALVGGGAVVLACWWLVPSYLSGHDPRTIGWFRAFLVAAVVFVPVSTAVELLRARSSLTAFNVLRSFPLVLNAILVVALSIAGQLRFDTALGAYLVAYGTWYIVVLTTTKAWPGRGFRRATFRLQVRYGSRVALGTFANVLIARLDQFLLVGFVSSAELGRYAVAVTAAGVSGPVALAVAFVLFPRVQRAADAHAGWRATSQSLRLVLVLSTGFAFLAAVLAPWVLPFLFGSDFRGAITPLWILLPGQIAADLATVLAQKLLADGRPGVVSRALAVAALLTVVALVIVVGSLGIAGAACVTTASQFVFLGYLWFAVRNDRRASADAAAGATDATEG